MKFVLHEQYVLLAFWNNILAAMWENKRCGF